MDFESSNDISRRARTRTEYGLISGASLANLNGLSTSINHCSVARKMTGFLQRQQWGYSWANSWWWKRALVSLSLSMTSWLASQMDLPRKNVGTVSSYVPFARTGE